MSVCSIAVQNADRPDTIDIRKGRRHVPFWPSILIAQVCIVTNRSRVPRMDKPDNSGGIIAACQSTPWTLDRRTDASTRPNHVLVHSDLPSCPAIVEFDK